MLIFLKLGGSLVTAKDQPYTARVDMIKQVASEILSALKDHKELKLLIGHGSGSFGHYAAKDSGTRYGVTTDLQWRSFQQVWYAARSLNNIIVDELNRAGLPVISFQPSASITANNQKIKEWNITPILQSINHGMIPIIHGDVIFDQQLGGVILSTEDLFISLVDTLRPGMILIAGKEEGVYSDYPHNKEIIPLITLDNSHAFSESIHTSGTIDVTGGMQEKVKLMLAVIQKYPDVQIQIFCGERPGNILHSIAGKMIGTRIAIS